VLDYTGFISQARDDIETCFSCIIRGLKFASCRRFWNTRQEGFPLPQGRGNYKFRRCSDKCMALVRSVDVCERVIGLYFVVISHELWNTAFNKEYLHTIVLKRKSWRDMSKKSSGKFMEMYFLCRAVRPRTVRKFGVTGAVRLQDQYDYSSGMITGPVWLWSQEIRTSMFTGTVSVVGMITEPGWSQCQYVHNIGMIIGWSQDPEEFVLKNQLLYFLLYLCSKNDMIWYINCSWVATRWQ
jgi:hypothetical protein